MTEEEWRDIEETVAAHDPGRHVATFFAPTRARNHLLALYAFDRELAHIGEAIREPMAGHVRLAWWREQLGVVYDGGAPASPTGRALAEAIKTHTLPRALLDAVIDARAHDLDETPFADEAALEAHADATTGNIMRLAARVLRLGDRADTAARHAAIAYAYNEHIRDLAQFAKLRRCRVPLAWLAEENLNAEDIFAATSMTPALQRIATRAATRTKAALAAANAARFPPSAMPALSYATLARVTGSIAPWQRVTRIVLATLMWRI
ncbi:MAG: phytoene/squalene synthase family protein [Micropepsaceae bacterium]